MVWLRKMEGWPMSPAFIRAQASRYEASKWREKPQSSGRCGFAAAMSTTYCDYTRRHLPGINQSWKLRGLCYLLHVHAQWPFANNVLLCVNGLDNLLYVPRCHHCHYNGFEIWVLQHIIIIRVQPNTVRLQMLPCPRYVYLVR